MWWTLYVTWYGKESIWAKGISTTWARQVYRVLVISLLLSNMPFQGTQLRLGSHSLQPETPCLRFAGLGGITSQAIHWFLAMATVGGKFKTRTAIYNYTSSRLDLYACIHLKTYTIKDCLPQECAMKHRQLQSKSHFITVYQKPKDSPAKFQKGLRIEVLSCRFMLSMPVSAILLAKANSEPSRPSEPMSVSEMHFTKLGCDWSLRRILQEPWSVRLQALLLSAECLLYEWTALLFFLHQERRCCITQTSPLQ